MKKCLPLLIFCMLLSACAAPSAPTDAAKWEVMICTEDVHAIIFEYCIDRTLLGGMQVSMDLECSQPLPGNQSVSASVPAQSDMTEREETGRFGIIVNVPLADGREHVIPYLYEWLYISNERAYFVLTGSAEKGFALQAEERKILKTPLDELPESFW